MNNLNFQKILGYVIYNLNKFDHNNCRYIWRDLLINMPFTVANQNNEKSFSNKRDLFCDTEIIYIKIMNELKITIHSIMCNKPDGTR